MTIKDYLSHITKTIKDHSPTPELDARVLVSHILQRDTTQLILQRDQDIAEVDRQLIDQLVIQRINNIPIPYIIGFKEFYGHTFIVTPDVLIPRPDTECMIDWLSNHPELNGKTIVDVGTGSGCIAISIQHVFPDSTVIGTDISASALSIAQKNDTLISGKDQCQVQWYHGDLLQALPPTTRPQIILANLPYLDQNRYTDDSIRHEPDLALYSPQKGLEHYHRLVEYLTRHLFFVPEILIVEINPEQYPEITNLVIQAFPNTHCEIIYDYAGDIRHIVFSISTT